MAGRTLVLPAVRIRRVPLDKIRDMEATTAAARVAVGAESLLVTTRTGERSGGGGDAVVRTELGIVHSNRARLAGSGVLTNQ